MVTRFGHGPRANRAMSVEEVAARVPDGCTLAIGGLAAGATPMALVREIVRQGKRDLTLVAIVSGMAVDWLIAGGCVARVITGLVSFEGAGLAPHFRRAAEAGRIAVEEYSEFLLIARLRAHASRLPFMPTKAGLGTDVIALHPDTTRVQTDPVTGEPYVACTPLPVDVALVHAHAADALGNVRVDPKLVWMDNEIVNAAGTVLVSVERFIPHAAFRAEPHRTTYPRFLVDGVTEVPWGAYPTSCYPEYSHDPELYRSYVEAARDPQTFRAFWEACIAGPATHAAYLEANGGAAMLARIRRRAR